MAMFKKQDSGEDIDVNRATTGPETEPKAWNYPLDNAKATALFTLLDGMFKDAGRTIWENSCQPPPSGS